MAEGLVRVCVVFSPAPRDVREWPLDVPAGSTVSQAIAASPLHTAFPALEQSAMTVGVWGRKATPGQVLREGDRVEIYRPLQVDPKVARRERFRRQGARAAGLFARGGAPKK
jgi:putative ubiquitin-RnfH superfamily antitoxin RatB of RatAB toxin-antitoxin module